jgi:hypothetical protein
MGRPENPISDLDSDAAQIALGLRDLRRATGSRPYKDLARATPFSASTLSRAASGQSMPSWEVVRSFVLACGGDTAAWERQWQVARDRSRCRSGPSSAPDKSEHQRNSPPAPDPSSPIVQSSETSTNQTSLADLERQLVEDLRRLCRGRGLYEPGFDSRVGPTLVSASGLEQQQSPGLLRASLARLLSDLCASLPADLREVAMFAFALAGPRQPLLRDRIMALRRPYDVRTLSRRLNQALQLLAEQLVVRVYDPAAASAIWGRESFPLAGSQ